MLAYQPRPSVEHHEWTLLLGADQKPSSMPSASWLVFLRSTSLAAVGVGCVPPPHRIVASGRLVNDRRIPSTSDRGVPARAPLVQGGLNDTGQNPCVQSDRQDTL